MSAQCQVCAGRTSDLNLCGVCQATLKDMLIGLAVGQELPNGHRAAGFIENLQDAVWGRTRLGESARRSSEKGSPALAHLTNHPEDSFIGSPSELLDNIHGMLLKWVAAVNTNTETLGTEG